MALIQPASSLGPTNQSAHTPKFNEKENRYEIKGSSYTGKATTENVVGNWWSHKILQTSSQISPISGSIKEQVVTFIGKEKIKLYGKIHEVEIKFRYLV